MPIDFEHLTEEEQRNFEFLRERRLAQLAALLIEERGLSFSDAFHELRLVFLQLSEQPHHPWQVQPWQPPDHPTAGK